MSKTTIMAKIVTTDAKEASTRRFRNILANSGDVMESGEIRDIKNLYVMGYDGKLFRIADLNPDPEKQTEEYSVKAQADHGKVELGPDGEAALVPSIEKQFGSCRVWLEKDGLHARMYFADNDQLADHAYAISQDASYSIGADWYPDGYYGTGYEIEEPIGILREISMVLTGNDPRAKTIDHKATEAEAQGRAEVASDTNQYQPTGDSNMSRKLDELTPDEREAMQREVAEVINRFTADVPEDETEPTADEAPEAEETVEAPAEAEGKAEEAEPAKEEESKEEKTTDGMPFLVIKEKDTVKQEVVKTADWLHSEAGHKAFADTLRRAGRLGATFDAMWKAEAEKHMSLDGITGLPNPAPVDQMFVDGLEKADGIISHFRWVSAKSFRVHILASESRAAGHKKGDTKVNQAVTDTTRDLLVKMVYKRLDLDATELYENPWLIDFRSQELVDAIIAEIERAAIVGDGRSSATPDLRMFDGTRGFYSVIADCNAQNALADKYATAEGGNLYDGVVGAKGLIRTEGGQIIIAKSSVITAMLQAKANGQYLVTPGARIEDILGVDRVYTPGWMENETEDAILLVNNAYIHGGEQGIRVRPDFDTSNNTDILLDETPRFGSLAAKKSAVAITLTA